MSKATVTFPNVDALATVLDRLSGLRVTLEVGTPGPGRGSYTYSDVTILEVRPRESAVRLLAEGERGSIAYRVPLHRIRGVKVL